MLTFILISDTFLLDVSTQHIRVLTIEVNDMLDKRKQSILRAIVDDYISTAEPIGSRTIAKKYSLGISPATIRNEMADLESLGYIKHLHTSSGRIPSSKGYRFYVDDLITIEEMPESERLMINDWYQKRVQSFDEIFQETATLISQLTQNVTFVLAPQLGETKFRYLSFLPLNSKQVIAVIMTDAGFMDNSIIDIPQGLSFEHFSQLADLFNKNLAGKSLTELSRTEIANLSGNTSSTEICNKIINIIDQALSDYKKEILYLGGTRQLVEQPEFHDINKVKKILSLFDDHDILHNILVSQSGKSLSVSIGQENINNEIKDCSIISASYHLDNKPIATISVLGPTRMDYARIISLLNFLNENLASIMTKFYL